ncbi:MAG TPA: glycoside hydrolase family 18 protein [Candidatus Sulfotelmatobacter sp.]|nr:glycoside hydrolase family 18 protein [Candidatus Sulfotelmatobacter sp.]
MANEVFVCYWIGEYQSPLPTPNTIPARATIVPFAFIGIQPDYTLGFGDVTAVYPQAQLQQWIDELRARGTKVLLSVLGSRLGTVPADQVDTLVGAIVDAVQNWKVDGVDLDYEPPSADSSFGLVVQRLRSALPSAILTLPVYDAWLFGCQDLLKQVAPYLDYVTTMDYSPYPGYDQTIARCKQYAALIGGWSKLVIGVCCMNPANSKFTPIGDVATFAKYEPKGGVMLYTFPYDLQKRMIKQNGQPVQTGTQLPDQKFTDTIIANLPRT